MDESDFCFGKYYRADSFERKSLFLCFIKPLYSSDYFLVPHKKQHPLISAHTNSAKATARIKHAVQLLVLLQPDAYIKYTIL